MTRTDVLGVVAVILASSLGFFLSRACQGPQQYAVTCGSLRDGGQLCFDLEGEP